MNIHFQTIGLKAEPRIMDVISGKLERLNRMYQRMQEVKVILKEEKSDTKRNKTLEIRIKVPEKELFVMQQDSSFENATDKAVDALKQQISRLKGKLQDH
jgi:putative sigma-54 modulation protein